MQLLMLTTMLLGGQQSVLVHFAHTDCVHGSCVNARVVEWLTAQHGSSYCIRSSTCVAVQVWNWLLQPVCVCLFVHAMPGRGAMAGSAICCPAVRPSVCWADKHPDLQENTWKEGPVTKSLFLKCAREDSRFFRRQWLTAPQPILKSN